MRIRFTIAAAAGLFVLAGCSDDSVNDGTAVQLADAALVRYVNAVADTSGFDVRFVDGSIEGSPQYSNITYRQFTPYQRVRPGARNIRIFTNPSTYGNDAAVAQQKHIDTTITFDVNQRYTVISYGFARAGAAVKHRLVVIRDEFPTNLTATQVGVRTIHAAAGVANVDVYVRQSEAATAISGTPTAANVAPLGTTAWVNFTTRPTGGTLVYRWDLAPAGTTTGLTVTPSNALAGVVGTAAANPLAGVQVGRTLLTAIVFGPSVTGSRAPSTAEFLNAGMRFLPDRALDSTEP
jgi:hypothetical protein